MSNENKVYKRYKLKNELDTLLYSTPSTNNISYGALLVNVGSDSENILESAHLLEHILFMGNSKYKNESDIFILMNSISASVNGFTGTEIACYFFDIPNENLEKGLEIFSSIFYEPNFDIDMIKREINAVKNEKNISIINEYWRINDVLKYNINKVFENKNTIYNTDVKYIQRDIRNFFNKYYSANNMKLVIQSDYDLTYLEKITNKYFSDIKNNNVIPEKNNSALITTTNFFTMTPIKNEKMLTFCWSIPYNIKYSHIYNFIIFLLSCKLKDSLYSKLKSSLLISDVTVTEIENIGDFALLSINYILTKDSMNNIFMVYNIVNKYIYYLESSYIKKIYNKYAILNNVRIINRKDSLNKVIEMAQRMNIKTDNIIDDVIFNFSKKYDDQIGKIFLESLKYMHEKYVFILSKNISGNTTKMVLGSFERNEHRTKTLGVNYSKFTKDMLQNDKKNYIYCLPCLNIKKSVNLINHLETSLTYHPDDANKIYSDDYFDLYFKHGTHNKSVILISICDFDIYKKICFLIFIEYFEYINEEMLYNSYLESMYHDILLSTNLIIITVDADSDFFMLMLHKFIDLMINTTFDKKIFDIIVENIKKDLSNYIFIGPYESASNLINDEMQKYEYSYNVYQEKLENFTLDKFIDILENIHISKSLIFYQGNQNIASLKNILLNEKLKYSKCNTNLDFVRLNKINKIFCEFNFHENCIIYCYNIGYVNKSKFKNMILVNIFHLHIKYYFFDELRTKKQYGYLVKSDVSTIGSLYNPFYQYRFEIQSQYKTNILIVGIENFVKNIKFNKEEFEMNKKAYIDKIKINNFDTNLTNILMGITNKDFIKVIEEILFDDLINFHKLFFLNPSINIACIIKN